MERRSAVFAIRPALAVALLQGTKQIEFRRVRPALEPGDRVFVYSTSPTQAIVGDFECGKLFEGKPELLWRKFRHNADTPRALFKEYFAECDWGCAIEVVRPIAWDAPLSLAAIRRQIGKFHPPQSYKFLAPRDPLMKLIVDLSNGR